ncbi:SDR family oxidoreductase [Acanthopleuribacter pedis]|uniref:SDR family oxidoreductase n=1 Tax=Acanthopleuribacter pedis TaxID=442870 RepID=A0A8J7QE61_9BACT|nr:SDR family oxidoreductase [Acanthopleuribacter pedis]MBO1317990.1 SDR family oxidoreductase [Acanthopleuribacter pedis]
MKALVTGGAGFIGSHLCELLLQQGLQVTAVDNFETGRESNLATFGDNPDFQLVTHDICQADGLSAIFSGADWVFHLAGLADIVPSIEKPERYFACNVTGTLNVLQAARDNNVKRLVYAASSSCYGLPDTFPTPESAEIRPQYPYALTKRMGEELVLHWAQVYQLPALSLRLFNVYGPRSRTTGAYGAVFGVFLAQKLNGKPFTVVGDGRQTRDFTFVTDVARAFYAAAASARSGEVYNVGSGDHYSINRLVSLLEGPVTHIPKRPGEPDCTFADTTRIRADLAWQPDVSFEDGVARMLASIQDWSSAPVWDEAGIKKATATWFRHLGETS